MLLSKYSLKNCCKTLHLIADMVKTGMIQPFSVVRRMDMNISSTNKINFSVFTRGGVATFLNHWYWPQNITIIWLTLCWGCTIFTIRWNTNPFSTCRGKLWKWVRETALTQPQSKSVKHPWVLFIWSRHRHFKTSINLTTHEWRGVQQQIMGNPKQQWQISDRSVVTKGIGGLLIQ